MFFPSPAGRLGVKNAALESLRGVLLAQGLKTHGAPIARKDQRGVFAVKPEGILLRYFLPFFMDTEFQTIWLWMHLVLRWVLTTA